MKDLAETQIEIDREEERGGLTLKKEERNCGFWIGEREE